MVLASRGYPEKPESGDPVAGLDRAAARERVSLFHAGTAEAADSIVTSGGRVLNVTATGANLEEARTRAYEAAGDISFSGCQFRRDIGWR